jgi:serine/threonine-protein kinase
MPKVIGQYAVRGKLGEGAFGVVYKGHDEALERDVAIKVLQPSALGSPKYVERFLREAKVVARLRHENIVSVHQLGQHEGGYFIASEFVAGRPLAAAVPEDGLEPRRAARLVVQLLDALAYAHGQGVLHRDVKPANAMLGADDKLFLMDFGLAGLVGQDEGRMTQDGTVMGTPSYMAPEQARGAVNEVGPAADQYSAGVVLYELLTGHLPFEGGPSQVVVLYNVINTPAPALSSWRPDLDPGLETICLRALSKDPGKRFASCREFADALREWLALQAPPTRAPVTLRARPAPAGSAKPRPEARAASSAGNRTTVKGPGGRTAVAEPAPVSAAERPRGGAWRVWVILGAAGLTLTLVLAAAAVLFRGGLLPTNTRTAPARTSVGTGKGGIIDEMNKK